MKDPAKPNLYNTNIIKKQIKIGWFTGSLLIYLINIIIVYAIYRNPALIIDLGLSFIIVCSCEYILSRKLLFNWVLKYTCHSNRSLILPITIKAAFFAQFNLIFLLWYLISQRRLAK